MKLKQLIKKEKHLEKRLAKVRAKIDAEMRKIVAVKLTDIFPNGILVKGGESLEE